MIKPIKKVPPLSYWLAYVQICANRKFDDLMLSANFKILHLLYKGLTDGPGVESPGFKK